MKNNKETNTMTIEKTFLVIKILPSTNPSRKPSQSPSTTPTFLQILNPSGKPSRFPTQQPSVVPTFPPSSIPSKKTSHISSSGQIDHTSVSQSVAMSVHPSPLPSITTTKFNSDVLIEKPIDKPIIHSLKDPTGLRMYKNHVEYLREAVGCKKNMQERLGNITAERDS